VQDRSFARHEHMFASVTDIAQHAEPCLVRFA
jgi:hypothetical protein